MFEHSLKNAYIGEYWEYSYDFTTGSTTDLANKGWTVPGTATINSNGLSATNTRTTLTYNNTPGLSNALGWAKNIHFELEATKNNNNVQARVEISGSNITGAYFDLERQRAYVDGTAYPGNTKSYSVGTYTMYVDVDLINKTVRRQVPSLSLDNTYSITDTQIANTRTYTNLGLSTASGGYVRKISITIS